MSLPPLFLLAAVFTGVGYRTYLPPVNVTVMPQSPKPGDTVRVDIIGMPSKANWACRFQDCDYPVFMTGNQKGRALIGLHGEATPGTFPAEITKAGRRKAIASFTISISNKELRNENLRIAVAKTKLSQDPQHGEAVVLAESFRVQGKIAKMGADGFATGPHLHWGCICMETLWMRQVGSRTNTNPKRRMT